MNSYSKFTDLKINELVATRLKKKCLLTEESVLAYMDSGYRSFNPCNNPADAMPIIIENKISAVPQLNGDLWICSHHPFYVTTNNLYRAAMETYLLIKDAENEKV